MKKETLRALHAQWRNLSPTLAIEPPDNIPAAEAERWCRMKWTNRHLHAKRPNRDTGRGKPDISSWNELSEGEAKYLLKIMREESGDGPAYRATLIARLAVELWGSYWDEYLRERMRQRFAVTVAENLAPAEAHTLIEELLDRVARERGETVEAVRDRVKRSRKSGARSQNSEAAA